MINFKDYLIERIDVEKTVKNMGDKLEARMKNDSSTNVLTTDPYDVIQTAMENDPTPNKKYTMWILRTYLNGGIHYLEDMWDGFLLQSLGIFDKFKQRMPIKDINQIKSLSIRVKNTNFILQRVNIC